MKLVLTKPQGSLRMDTWNVTKLLKQIDYALRKDSFCDAEKIESARQLVARALEPSPEPDSYRRIYDKMQRGKVSADKRQEK